VEGLIKQLRSLWPLYESVTMKELMLRSVVPGTLDHNTRLMFCAHLTLEIELACGHFGLKAHHVRDLSDAELEFAIGEKLRNITLPNGTYEKTLDAYKRFMSEQLLPGIAYFVAKLGQNESVQPIGMHDLIDALRRLKAADDGADKLLESGYGFDRAPSIYNGFAVVLRQFVRDIAEGTTGTVTGKAIGNFQSAMPALLDDANPSDVLAPWLNLAAEAAAEEESRDPETVKSAIMIYVQELSRVACNAKDRMHRVLMAERAED